MPAHLKKESEFEWVAICDGGPPLKVPLDGLSEPPRSPSRKRRGRVPVDALAHEGLFLLLTYLRAANARSLFDLHFKPRGVKWRTAMRRLHDLVAAGYLAHFRLDNARCVYHLTEKACALTPALRLREHSALYTTPPDRQAAYCWLRSTIVALLTAMGYVVGNDPAAVQALRRFLIDSVEGMRKLDLGRHITDFLAALRANMRLRVTPAEHDVGYRLACRVCGAVSVGGEHRHAKTKAPCNGRLRAWPAGIFDIAWKKVGSRFEVIVLVIDNPTLSLDEQLETLRSFALGYPVLPVIVRSTDARSRFDLIRNVWIETGPRHAQLLAAIEKANFQNLIKLVDPWPTLQAYPVRDARATVVPANPQGWKPRGGGKKGKERREERERERDGERDRASPLREIERAPERVEYRARGR